ncbi:MAG: hypothetical protein QM754_03510 [Tepidisphaeraceae bacterium]
MKNRSLIVAAVVAALASGVFAQTRVDRSGATDANNRVGANGRNQTGGRDMPWEIQNRIVYGNVTGGKAFRGNLSSTDAQAFRGQTASQNMDRFVRSSSGVTTGGVATYNANETKAYYGDSRGVNAPAGTVTVGNTGSYSPPTPTQWRNVDVRTAAVSADPTVVTPFNSNTIVSGGAVDNQYAPAARVAVPPSLDNLSDYTNLNTLNPADGTTQVRRLPGDADESKTPGQTPDNGANSNMPADPGSQQTPATGSPTTPTGQTPTDNAVTTPQVNTAVTDANAPEAGTVTKFSARADTPVDRSVGKAGVPDADSAQPTRPGQAAEQATREYNAEVRRRQADAAKPDANKPDAGNNNNAGNNGGAPGGQPQPGMAPGRLAPADAATKGLGDLLTKAEGQMKDGKFATAIDTYAAAEAVAPKSATVKLGRANAELGGAFYRRAETSLRQAYALDKNLLGSQHDLRGFLGDEKLAAVQKDLAEIVQNKQTDTGAAVLLAYVYYNTGNEARAAALLDVADKRAAGRDTLVKAMKATWKTGGTETK